jgi:hypothetical protein
LVASGILGNKLEAIDSTDTHIYDTEAIDTGLNLEERPRHTVHQNDVPKMYVTT